MSTKRPTAAPKRRATAKPKPRRVRCDSASAAVQAVKNAQAAETLAPPPEAMLPDRALPIWRQIIAARAFDEWTGPDLHTAAALARGILRAYECEAIVDRDGPIITGANGTPVSHPALAMAQQIGSKNLALARALRINPLNLPGGRSDPTKRRDLERKVRALTPGDDDPSTTTTDDDDDDLLA